MRANWRANGLLRLSSARSRHCITRCSRAAWCATTMKSAASATTMMADVLPLSSRVQNDLSGYYSRNQTIHDKINDVARNSALR